MIDKGLERYLEKRVMPVDVAEFIKEKFNNYFKE